MNQQEDIPQETQQNTSSNDNQPLEDDGEKKNSKTTIDTLAELQFEFLKQISTLALLSAGGIITLIRTVFADIPDLTYAFWSIGLLIVSALTALTAQQYLVERYGEQIESEKEEYLFPKVFSRTRKIERFLQNIAVAFLAIGIGLFAGFVIGSW